MNINQINSGNFSEKDIKKSQKSSTAGPEKGNTDNTTQSKEVPGDRFTPSGTKMRNEFDLAANELAKLKDSSFASLRDIKKKIEAGAYDNQKVHQKIGTLVEKDLNSLEQILSTMPGSDGVDSEKKALAPEYKQYLIENPKVIEKVADQVAADLKKL